jgi:hypothetical protein
VAFYTGWRTEHYSKSPEGFAIKILVSCPKNLLETVPNTFLLLKQVCRMKDMLGIAELHKWKITKNNLKIENENHEN